MLSATRVRHNQRLSLDENLRIGKRRRKLFSSQHLHRAEASSLFLSSKSKIGHHNIHDSFTITKRTTTITMKLLLILPFVSSAVAFHVASPLVVKSMTTSSRLYASTAVSSGVDVTLAKYEVLETARRLKSENGVLVIDSISQEELKQAVETLELLATPPTDVDELVGDWTLLCSTASASPSGPLENLPDFPKLPFMNQGPLSMIRDLLNKSFQVQQIIKTSGTGDIDRIDHVLEYNPPNTLAEFLNDIPDALKTLNINPLQVSKSKVILVHKAQVESVVPVIKTKLNLSSIVGTYVR
jgi:hypothetical protein